MARRSTAARSRTRYSTVYMTVPVPRFIRTRTVSYSYPSQVQRRRRVVRVALAPSKPERFVMRRMAVRIPRHLPLVRPSYVSVRRGVLNIHSLRQTRALMEKGEYNRERNSERKGRRRQARNGQLDSMRSDRFGIVGEAVRRGLGAARIADAALVARGLRRSP